MKYNCPLCNSELTEALGNGMHPGDAKYGITVFCPSQACPAQEVMGHGETAKEAWGVVQAKFVTREKRA